MRFRTKGTFAAEAVIEIAQRLVAVLQDGDVAKVSRVNIYLTVSDKKGRSRALTLDGHEIDLLDIDCKDLALPEPQGKLGLAPETRGQNAKPRSYKPKRARA